MKKAIAFLLLLSMLFSLVSCAPAPAVENDGAAETPAPRADYSNRYENYAGTSIVENEYAFFGKSLQSQHLRYWDKATGQEGILCSRPDCDHSDINCNGRLSGDAGSLDIVDGKIWWMGSVGNGLCVFRMDLDGTNRERFLSNSISQLIYSSFSPINMKVLGDNVYLFGTAKIVEDGKIGYDLRVYRSGLDDSEGFTEIFSARYKDQVNCSVHFCGGILYITAAVIYNVNDFGADVFRVDLEAGTSETLLHLDRGERLLSNLWTDGDGTLYVSVLENHFSSVCIIKDGTLQQVMDFSDEDGNFTKAYFGNGAVYSLRNAEDAGFLLPESLWIRSIAGDTIYKGLWDQSRIKEIAGDRNYAALFMGGTTEFVIVAYLMSGGAPGQRSVFARYEVVEGRLEETILWRE